MGAMDKVVEMNDIGQYADYVGAKRLSPLVNVIDFSRLPPTRYTHTRKLYGFYAIYLRDAKFSALKYGSGTYDFQEGTLVFVAPGQIMGSEADGEYHQMKGYALLFHHDLLRNTSLEHLMQDYPYFSYTSNKSLRLSEAERNILLDIFKKIHNELVSSDELSLILVVDYVKLLLDYCLRLYNRQSAGRKSGNHEVLARFEDFLETYIHSGKLARQGMPTVRDCADELHLSSAYFGDIVKRETDMSVLKHIHRRVLLLAEEYLWDGTYSISQIAEALGFSYPQHFNRWFKKMKGCTPKQYRDSIQVV